MSRADPLGIPRVARNDRSSAAYNARMRRILLIVIIAFVANIAAAQAPQYDVYAIRYATITGFPVAGLIKGADESRKIDIAMMVWLVRGGGHNIVVDSGFYRPQFFKSWKVTDFVRPDEAVAPAGVKPEEGTHVILPHAHRDHADSGEPFLQAPNLIQ